MADKLRKRIRDDPFTRISNGIFQDHALSLKARGLLCTALSLPDGWSFSIRGLMALSRDGRASVESALNELEARGYLRRIPQQGRKDNGQFGGMDYLFSDAPDASEERSACAENQHRTDAENQHGACVGNQHRTCAGFPHAGFPHAENQPQEINKQETKIQDTPLYPPTGEQAPRKKRTAFVHDSKAYLCAAYLDRKIRERLPEKKAADEGTLQRWADAFDKTNRIDGYSWEVISRVLQFSQTDEFWQKNILSGRTFREKFVRLYAKAAGSARETAGERYFPEVNDTW